MTATLFDLPEIKDKTHRIRLQAGARKNKREHDFYPTPEIATISFMEHEKFVGSIWEPACGDGAMSRVIERFGYQVKSTDLIDRGYGRGGVDFLRSSERADNIVTNPPFALANKFVHHALEHVNHKCAFLLRLNFLESKIRQTIFKKYPFARLYISIKRVPFTEQNAIAFGWFVWDYSHVGKPTIEWI